VVKCPKYLEFNNTLRACSGAENYERKDNTESSDAQILQIENYPNVESSHEENSYESNEVKYTTEKPTQTIKYEPVNYDPLPNQKIQNRYQETTTTANTVPYEVEKKRLDMKEEKKYWLGKSVLLLRGEIFSKKR
jgi:hypothetical protein